MKGNLITIGVVGALGLAVAFLAYDPGGKALTKGRASSKRITPAARAWGERTNEAYKNAARIWHVGHDPGTAASLFKGMISRHEAEPTAISALAELYAEQHDYADSLHWYRAIFAQPHPRWRSSDEQNFWVIGAYIDVATRLGEKDDVSRGENLILKYYRPMGNEPPLIWDPNSRESVHAYACAARALYRGENFNGVSMALEAVKAEPYDAVIRWVAGTVLFDAGDAKGAVAQYKAARGLGGLNPGQENVMRHHLMKLGVR